MHKLTPTQNILIVFLVFVFIMLTPSIYRAIFSPYLDDDVARDVTISSEWMEIVPKEPLKAERQIQLLVLETTPFTPDYKSLGLRLSDGSVVTPQVQLVDEQENVYDLKSSEMDQKGIGFSKRNPEHTIDLPTVRKYRAVRIRCDKPIHCSRIHWYCYNQWDRK